MLMVHLYLCQECDKYSMEFLERLFSYAAGIEEVTKCLLCNNANSKLSLILKITVS